MKSHFGGLLVDFATMMELLISRNSGKVTAIEDENFADFFHDGFALPAAITTDIRVVSH